MARTLLLRLGLVLQNSMSLLFRVLMGTGDANSYFSVAYIAALLYGIYVHRNVRNHMKGLYRNFSGNSESTRLTHAYT